MDFNSLIGKSVGFCGVDNATFCLQDSVGNRLAFEAVENPDDGLRSMMDEVRVYHLPISGRGSADKIFFHRPIVTVTVERDINLDSSQSDGYRLVDSAGHVWLRFGTDTTDYYYPMFIFDYTPPRVCASHDDCRADFGLAAACAGVNLPN
jgi:hypothetical protein